MSKSSDRWGVMLPPSCKPIVDRIIQETGIDTVGKVFEMLLQRSGDDFIDAYNAFMKRSAAAGDFQEVSTEVLQPLTIESKPQAEFTSFEW